MSGLWDSSKSLRPGFHLCVTSPALGPRPGVAAEVPGPPPFIQVEYLLKKLLGSMSLEMSLGELEELLAQDAQSAQTSGGLSVWQFLELFNSGRCLRGVGRDSLSMAIQEVYQELIQDVLKQVSQARSPGGDPRERAGWGWGCRRPGRRLPDSPLAAGLSVEARASEEELGRALVPATAQLPLLLWE